MTHDEFVEFINSFKEIVPFEITNSIAHIVFEDFNFRDSDIEYILDEIESNKYQSRLSGDDLEYLKDNPHHVILLKGVLKMLLLLPEDIRYMYEDDE